MVEETLKIKLYEGVDIDNSSFVTESKSLSQNR
jgi:hypothetical protein